MSGHIDVMLGVALSILVVMIATWVLSLVLRNASIVDIAWGLGFVVVAWVSRFIGDGHADRSALLTAMVTIWGLRLALYLLWRNHGEGEDFRYQSIRRRQGDSFPIRSLVTVFGFQGILILIVSLPVQLAATPADPGVGVLAIIGAILWGIGLFFETVGDAQLARFKANADSAGKIMDQGLWRYTRHPNYFGDFCVWWGLFLVAAESTDAWFGIIGPIVMTYMLIKVSGVAMLERGLMKRREGYAEYATRTPVFFPRPPSSVRTDA